MSSSLSFPNQSLPTATMWKTGLFFIAACRLPTAAFGEKADSTSASLKGRVAVHDASFVPDHVLQVTYDTIDVACESRTSVLINGSLPGPPIHISPRTQTWIRVYNHMLDQNLTMVCAFTPPPDSWADQASIGMAWPSAWHPLPTAARRPRNGQYRQGTFSTTKYSLSVVTLVPTTIIPTWGYKLSPPLAP